MAQQREAVVFDQDASAFASDDFRIWSFKVGAAAGRLSAQIVAEKSQRPTTGTPTPPR